MKTTTKILALVSISAMSLTLSTSAQGYVTKEDVLSNRAIASSPRAKEVFPWLNGAPAVQNGTAAFAVPAQTVKNRAISASPRMLELYPQLARTASPAPSSGPIGITAATEVLKNRAFAASPRAKEVFPWLGREESATCTCLEVAAVR